jgi:hypothetical protein
MPILMCARRIAAISLASRGRWSALDDMAI